MAGTLFLCATPIGNLGDITYRVVETLREADLIAAEDTRNSMKLCSRFDIRTPMTSYHEHNKEEKAVYLVGQLKEGKDVALVTDAGTPAVSDPGEVLVSLCMEEGIAVTSLPGPCACITALTLSGLSTRRFCFEGFLPPDKRERRQILDELCGESRTIILYEAPHHLRSTLSGLLEALGDRRMTICRELTKKFESVTPTTLSAALTYYEENQPRGEFVLVLEGKGLAAKRREAMEDFRRVSVEDHLRLYEERGMDRKEAMKAVARDRGIGKRDVYRYMLEREI